MAHGFQRFEVGLARFIEDLAPHIVVSGIELAVEANGRGFGCAFDAVGQVIAIGRFLSTSLEHTNASNELVQQFGQLSSAVR